MGWNGLGWDGMGSDGMAFSEMPTQAANVPATWLMSGARSSSERTLSAAPALFASWLKTSLRLCSVGRGAVAGGHAVQIASIDC